MSRRIARSSGLFFDQGVVEAVVLGGRQPLRGTAASELEPPGLRFAANERPDHLFVFLREHRAGDIQQFTTRREQLPKRFENGSLARCDRRRIAPARPIKSTPAMRPATSR